MIHFPHRHAIGILWMILLASPNARASTKSWKLFHSTSVTGTYVPRGTVTLSLSSSKDAESPVQLNVLNEEDAFTVEMVNEMISQEGVLYHLKLVEEGADNPTAIITTVPACQLRRSNFRDEFVLTFSELTGQVVSMAYIPLVSPLAPKSCTGNGPDSLPSVESPSDIPKTQSKISFEVSVPGMTLHSILPGGPLKPPPGLTFLPGQKKAGKDARAGGGNPLLNDGGTAGGGKDGDTPPDFSPMGLFKRYWYIIVPLLIMNFMSEPPKPEQGQQGQQQSGAAVASQPTAQPEAGAGKQRRGKRG